MPAPVSIGELVTATATNVTSAGPPLLGSTSEFSACRLVEPTIDLDKFVSGNADEDASGDVSLGDTLTYSFHVTNTGQLTLNDVTVVDPLPGLSPIDCGLTTSLAPAEDVTCTATYVVTQADVDAGSILNTATASGTEPLGAEVSDQDQESICVARIQAPVASMSVEESGTVLSWTPAGGAGAFDVVTGTLAFLRATGGDFTVATTDCLADDESGLSISIVAEPNAGQGVWFLVRRDDCSNGSYDTDSIAQSAPRDAGIAASGRDCP